LTKPLTKEVNAWSTLWSTPVGDGLLTASM